MNKSVLTDDNLIDYLKKHENLEILIGDSISNPDSFRHFYHNILTHNYGSFDTFLSENGLVVYNTFSRYVKGCKNKATRDKIILQLTKIFSICKIAYDVENKKWQELKTPEQQAISENDVKEVENLHFICYYWNERSPEKNPENKFDINLGYLNIKYSVKEGVTLFDESTALLKLYDQTGEQKATLNSIEVLKIEKNLFIKLQDSIDKFVVSQFCLSVGVAKIQHWKFLTGTYSTVARTHNMGEPLAGLIMFEKIDEEPSTQEINVMRSNPSDIIFHYLYKTRIAAQKITKLEDVRGFTEIAEITKNKYVGIYKGNFLRQDPDDKKYFIEPLIVKFYSNGHIEMAVKENGDSYRLYKGRFRIVSALASSIICYMEMQLPERVYRFTIYIKNKLFEHKYLYGVYAGIEYKKDFPIAGRIRLEKTTLAINSDIVELIAIEKCFEVINDADSIDNGIKKLLISGDHDNNYLDIIRKEKHTKSIQNYKGVYSIYQVSTRENDTVVEHPLKIESDGSVTLYNDNGWKFLGSANYSDKGELSIYFDRRVENSEGMQTNKDVFMHYLFSVKEDLPASNPSKMGGLKLAYGVSSKFNRQEKPVARAVILSFESNDLSTFKADKFKHYQLGSKSFYELDSSIEKTGVLSNLLGDYNRNIIFGSSPYKVKTVTKPKQYKNIHFYSACYWGSKYNETNDLEAKEECTKQLYQAYINGFNDLNLLNDEKSKSLRLVIVDSDSENLVISNGKELSATDIIDRITKHANKIAIYE